VEIPTCRLLVLRYPSRRAFLDLLSDPRYRKIEPYELMALAVVLTPTTGEGVGARAALVCGRPAAGHILGRGLAPRRRLSPRQIVREGYP